VSRECRGYCRLGNWAYCAKLYNGNVTGPVFPYKFVWNRPGLPGRKGESCCVLVRGKMNSCAIEFEDGFRAVVSRNAVRKKKPAVQMARSISAPQLR
jgi:hypothetical protein